MLLAGDIGATKTLIGLFAPAEARPRLVDVRTVTTLDYDSLETIIARFLDEHPAAGTITAATFGVAGPIVEQVARLTNVPWEVDAAAVRDLFGFPDLTLLNDLQAMAYSVPVLEPDELEVLQPGVRAPTGNAALIAAGTGLGEALLHYVDGRFIPSPTEGGHADYAPRTPREIGLLQALIRWHGRGEYEQVLSGPGLVNIHRYVHDGSPCGAGEGEDISSNPAMISAAGLDGRCRLCIETLDLFVTAYGAEAGNLALHSLASAGVFVGGGIAPKILPALRTGTFMDAFRDKGLMTDFLSQVPVSVILNDRAGLLGAAVHANETTSRGD
jgi:glucokinase